jgi:hypothetical protein
MNSFTPSYMHRLRGKKVFPYDTSKTKPEHRLVLENPKKLTTGCCVIRSNLEEKFARWCDRCHNVIAWSSEQVFVQYWDPISRKIRRYYPDFALSVMDKDGKVNQFLVEIKMTKEVKEPLNRPGKNPTLLRKERALWKKNQSKWIAAGKYCKDHNIEFKIITEVMLDRLGDRI